MSTALREGDHRSSGDARRATWLITFLVVLVSCAASASATAATYVTQCSAANWPDGVSCPANSYPPRHSYYTGRGASAGSTSGHLYSDWYVAYASSNASLPKYSFGDRVGNILYAPMGNNTDYLRGYIYTTAAGPANIFNEGGY